MIIAVLDILKDDIRYVLTAGYGSTPGAQVKHARQSVSAEEILEFAKERGDIAVYSGHINLPAEEIRRSGYKNTPQLGMQLFSFFDLKDDNFRG